MNEITIEIKKYDNTGKGIGYNNNKIAFIPNTYIGDILKVEIIKENKNIIDVKVKEILKESPIRTKSICKYKNCGGCNYLNIKYEDEINIKRDVFKNLFNINNVDIISPKDYVGYRNKIILHYNKKIGLYEKQSNNIVNINECKLVKPEINKIIKELNGIHFNDVERILIKSGEDSIVIIYSKNKINFDLKLSTNNIVNIYNNKINIIKGKDYITYKINNYVFKSSLDSFFQTNESAAYNIVNYIIKLKLLNRGTKLLELYCGNGSFGIQLSKYVKRVFGVEINKLSIEDAINNIKINKINNAEFICGDLNNFKNLTNKYDVVLLDPPRSGLSKNIINYLLQNNFKNIIYISCNPLTLKNDINILNSKYYIDDIKLIDMFPRTNHVECVCLLKLR